MNDTVGEFSELVADTGTAATTYTDNTVAASTHYTYRIKAINEHGVSERSARSYSAGFFRNSKSSDVCSLMTFSSSLNLTMCWFAAW